ncbi:MAG: class I SAM-dependent methyltransferase [Deltaproteobacteria bacterium]|nr:class I SAM-dependent methyltransferase [Deltaproteobacteria bacterium]
MSNYLKVVYNEKDRPFTDYPSKLAKYLFDRYGLRQGEKLLEIGCGRGEFLANFNRLGLDVKGADISPEAVEFNKDMDIRVVDVESQPLPFSDNTFDIVYSKSVIEHFYYPEKYVKEVFRVLKPGGICITLVPEWEANMKIYFDDFTHRTPFTAISLRDIYLMHGFNAVKVEKFRQLPFLWKFPVLNPICAFIAMVSPRSNIKLIRFSKEIMLLSSCKKP